MKEEDVLVSVPRQLILSAATATDSRVVRDLLPAVEGTILADPMVALALLLLYEKNLGPASFWAPYFHILPLPPPSAATRALCRYSPGGNEQSAPSSRGSCRAFLSHPAMSCSGMLLL